MTQRASAKAYEQWRAAHKPPTITPYPMTIDVMNLFCGHLLISDYKRPENELNAALAMNSIDHTLDDPKGDVSLNLKAFERAGVATEQSLPVSLRDFKIFAENVTCLRDLDAFLATLGAWFLCARPDSFLSIDTKRVILSNNKVQIKITKAKGKHSFKHEPELEKLPQGEVLKLENYDGSVKSIKLCPVAVFKTLKDRAVGDTISNFGSGTAGYAKWETAVRRLMKKCGHDDLALKADPERARFGYTLYMSRVGGVCTLLKAGLDPVIITTLAAWESDVISRYGAKVALQPDCVDGMRFFNPVSHANRYNSGSAASAPAAKRQKKK
jgi:hypothetical protein